MKARETRRGERGLTLVEMVLTLTILALAGALIYGGLGTALRAWQQGFAQGREELVARVVLERMAGQLRSVVAAPAKRSGEDAVAFAVTGDSLRFVTLLSASGAAPAQVGYALADDGGKRALVYREYPWPDKNFFGQTRPRREERVPEVTGLKVSVAPRADEEASGPSVTTGEPWKATDAVLPGSVTIEITAAAPGGEARTYELTVPLEIVSAVQ
jgi:prepilin-type N-terminal cleavage/methylation domain-containing protein